MMPPIAAPFPPPATADDPADGRTDARAPESLRGLVVALRASFVVNLDCVAIQGLDSHENSGEPVKGFPCANGQERSRADTGPPSSS